MREKKTDNVRDTGEIFAGHGHGGRSRERPRGFPPGRADHPGKFGAQRIEFRLGARCREVIAAATLRGINVDADLGQAALDHEPFEQARLAAESLAMRHQHRHQPDLPRIPDQGDHLALVAQRDFAIGDLHIADGTEPGADFAQLLPDLFRRTRPRSVCIFAEVAARAGKITLRHRADDRPAARDLPPHELRGAAHGCAQPRRGGGQRLAGLSSLLSESHAKGGLVA